MKTATASLVVLSGLVSLTTADALPPEDVPVQCATICGPIVELSSKCTPAKSRRNQVGDSTNQTSNPWIGRRQDVVDSEKRVVLEADDDGELERRFFTIVPAPTSFAAKYSSILNPGGDGTLTLQQESSPTRITPVIVRPSNPPPPPPPAAPAIPSSQRAAPPPAAPAVPSSQPPSPPPPAPSVPSPSKQVSITSNSNPTPTRAETKSTSLAPDKVQSTMSLMDNTGSTDGSPMDSEEGCVCLNKSFDVPRVAALCTSCIVQNGFPKTNMHVVMSVCGFSELNYTSRDDSLVDNIRVSATRPSAVWGHNAGVSNGGGTPRVGIDRGGIGLCVLISVALLLI